MNIGQRGFMLARFYGIYIKVLRFEREVTVCFLFSRPESCLVGEELFGLFCNTWLFCANGGAFGACSFVTCWWHVPSRQTLPLIGFTNVLIPFENADFGQTLFPQLAARVASLQIASNRL